ELRQRVMRTFGDLGPKLRGVAIVMGGSGFWASAARSTIAVLLISIARGYQAKIFATTDEAASWLADKVNVGRVVAREPELRRVARELASR
ncbi:MAG TPA: hypothetical protein VHB21_15800, partial [Minicystis sp.]|nr:hypothetical protein [Minicystis sp.]